MVVAPMILLMASAAAPADRLDYGTVWQCVSPFTDGVRADFTILRGEPGKPSKPSKKLVFTRSSTTNIPTGGYGSGRAERSSQYDPREAKKGPDYIYAEYVEGFYDYGVSITANWSSPQAHVEVSIRTFDWKNRRDPDLRNERSFLLNCRSAG